MKYLLICLIGDFSIMENHSWLRSEPTVQECDATEVECRKFCLVHKKIKTLIGPAGCFSWRLFLRRTLVRQDPFATIMRK